MTLYTYSKTVVDCVLYTCVCCKQTFYYEKWQAEFGNFCPFCGCKANKGIPCELELPSNKFLKIKD